MVDEIDLPEAPEILDVPEESEETENQESAEPFDDTNAAVLAELISDPVTSEFIKLQILNSLLAAEASDNFFETMFKNKMDFCECPSCGHEDYWLTPEDSLNQMGYVTADHDERVHKHTTEKDCSKYAEACIKKRVSG